LSTGIIAAVVVAGATVYSASSQASAAKKAAAASARNRVAPVDLQEEQTKALDGNLANQKKIETLVSSTNAFDQSQATTMMESAIPGFSALQGKLMATTNDLLTNPYELPKDVQTNLERLAAERGVSAGTRGTFNEFSLLRDFGVNSLQYGQSRISQAGSLAGIISSIAPKANVMSPLSFYNTPQQYAANQQMTNANNQATTQGAINANLAASNYQNAGIANAVTGLAGAAGSVDWSKLGGSRQAATGKYNLTPASPNAAQQAQAGSDSFWE
jgi:hypothetical protein